MLTQETSLGGAGEPGTGRQAVSTAPRLFRMASLSSQDRQTLHLTLTMVGGEPVLYLPDAETPACPNYLIYQSTAHPVIKDNESSPRSPKDLLKHILHMVDKINDLPQWPPREKLLED